MAGHPLLPRAPDWPPLRLYGSVGWRGVFEPARRDAIASGMFAIVRRSVRAVFAVFAVGTLMCACAALSGLNNYGPGDEASAFADDASLSEAPTGQEGGSPISDSGAHMDAGDASQDAVHHDAAQAACGPSNCSTCCTDAGCAPASANAACGSGGGVCDDCAAAGKVCRNGSCVQSVQTSCDASMCGPCPVPATPCCKSDGGGCGCLIVIPPVCT
jgi:hypothetical protein